MSSSESEDDFESASEGDDSFSYDEDVSDEEEQVPSSAIPDDQNQEVKFEAHSVDNKVFTSSGLENVSTHDENKEVVQILSTEPPVRTIVEIQSKTSEEVRNNLKLQNVQDQTAAALIPAIECHSISSTTTREISPNITQQPATERETVELAKSVGHLSISTDYQIKEAEKNSSEIQEPIQCVALDDAIPSDIVTKISTRSVSSRVRPNNSSKPKPTLGGKKLGGVKLSQPLESTATSLIDCDTEPFFPKVEKVVVHPHQAQ
jgi:hypothetical protein